MRAETTWDQYAIMKTSTQPHPTPSINRSPPNKLLKQQIRNPLTKHFNLRHSRKLELIPIPLQPLPMPLKPLHRISQTPSFFPFPTTNPNNLPQSHIQACTPQLSSTLLTGSFTIPESPAPPELGLEARCLITSMSATYISLCTTQSRSAPSVWDRKAYITEGRWETANSRGMEGCIPDPDEESDSEEAEVDREAARRSQLDTLLNVPPTSPRTPASVYPCVQSPDL